MTDIESILAKRKKMSYGLWQEIFSENPNFENAMRFFLSCRKYGQKIPEQVMQVITEKFIKDVEQYAKRYAKRHMNQEKDDRNDEIAIDCFLNSKNIREANARYYAETKNFLYDHGFRAKVKRLLEATLTNKKETPLPDLRRQYEELLK